MDNAQFAQRFLREGKSEFQIAGRSPTRKSRPNMDRSWITKARRWRTRNTFLINPKGEVVKVFTGVKPAEHSEEVLKTLDELQKG